MLELRSRGKKEKKKSYPGNGALFKQPVGINNNCTKNKIRVNVRIFTVLA